MEDILPCCHLGRILSQEIPWQVVANIYSEVANYLCKEAQPYPEREGSQNSKESTKNKSSTEDNTINEAANLFAYPFWCPVPT